MKILQLVIFMLTISACWVKSDKEQEPKRVNGIPEKAFWIGSVDSGNWYFVHDIHDHRNNAFISVYSKDGSLIITKRFMVICRLDRPVIWIENLEYQISGFNGQKILLKSPTGKEICWME